MERQIMIDESCMIGMLERQAADYAKEKSYEFYVVQRDNGPHMVQPQYVGKKVVEAVIENGIVKKVIRIS